MLNITVLRVIGMVELVELELDKIIVDKGLRKTFDEEAIGKLSSSVAEHGVLQPILVEPREGGLYTLLIGELRYRAAKRADLKTVPAIVFGKPLKEDKVLEIRLIENIQHPCHSVIVSSARARLYRFTAILLYGISGI